jgi:hypothetical protein
MRAILFPEPTEIVPGNPGFLKIEHAKIIDLPTKNNGHGVLAPLQELVRGNIEATVMPLDHSGYINEEGKLTDPPMRLNIEANSLWLRAVREGGMMTMPGDYLGGPVVILGPVDDEGWDTPVTDQFIALVRSMAIVVDD